MSFFRRGLSSRGPTLPVSASAEQQVGESSEQLIERQRQLRNELARNRYVPRSDRGLLRPIEDIASGERQRLQHRNEACGSRYVSPTRLHLPDENTDADSADARRLRRNETKRLRYAARHAANQETDEERIGQSARTATSRQDRLDRDATYSRTNRVAFKAVLQEWDSGHPCTHCGRVWLYSASSGLRKKCCMEGKLWDLNISPFILSPLPPVLESGFYNPDFVRSSNQYNNILSLGAVGVENAKEARGWDKIVGHHAVRLSGRT